MGKTHIKSSITKNSDTPIITQHVPKGTVHEKTTITITDHCNKKQKLTGTLVNVGNPHFILFQKQTLDWLTQNGKLIETDQSFPNKTNVEFVWQDDGEKDSYNVIVYERGCGITQACGSGAAAITSLLFYKKTIEQNRKITLCFPGGQITCWITPDEHIALQADAHLSCG